MWSAVPLVFIMLILFYLESIVSSGFSFECGNLIRIGRALIGKSIIYISFLGNSLLKSILRYLFLV
jgi:hypothetical protein